MLLVFLALWIFSTSTIPMWPMNILFMLLGILIVSLGVYSIAKNYLRIRGCAKASEEQEQAEDEKGPFTGYCPYCGSPVREEYAHCRVCGKKL